MQLFPNRIPIRVGSRVKEVSGASRGIELSPGIETQFTPTGITRVPQSLDPKLAATTLTCRRRTADDCEFTWECPTHGVHPLCFNTIDAVRVMRNLADIDKLLKIRSVTGNPLEIVESPPDFGCPPAISQSNECCGKQPAFSLEWGILSLNDFCALHELQELKTQKLRSVFVRDSAVNAAIFAELERHSVD